MEDRKRILHRLSYFNQVRERRVRIDNLWQPFPKAQKKENTEEPQKKESPERKSLLSRLLLFFAKPKAQKKENTPVDFPRQKLKKFATKLKAVDKDKKLKTFIGPEIIAKDVDEARAILDHNGQEYLEIIGELTAAYDLLGSNVTWQDRLN